MSRLLSSRTYSIYGHDYRIDFVSENNGTHQCCYEIYDEENKFVGTAGEMREVFDVIHDELVG